MNDLQKQLNDLYFDYLKTIFTDKELFQQVLNFEISSPIFLDCNAEFGNYLDSNFKILYVGKETNYWFNEKEREDSGLLTDISNYEKYIQALTDLYKTFNIGHNYKRAIFTFMDIFVEKFRNINGKTGILWTNLLRHDYYGNGKVPPEVEQKITFDKNYIFRKEVEVLKPDAIVFVTGPNYDHIIENTFVGLKKVTIENESEREICFLEHENLPKKTIRVYHPDYHWRINAEYRWNLVEQLTELIRLK